MALTGSAHRSRGRTGSPCIIEAVSPEAPARDGALPIPRTAVLDNGLKVLIQEARTAPLVSVWCWYRVESKDEPPGLTGAARGALVTERAAIAIAGPYEDS